MATDQQSYRRWTPLAVLAVLIAVAYASGLHRYLSLETIVQNKVKLESFVSAHTLVAVLIYAAVYIVSVALSLPGAVILTILGGFIFGWQLSAPVTVVAATIGAVIVFQIVKTSLGASIAERAGPFVARLSQGFANDAFNYMLFLRLVPAFPFFIVNAVAGLCRVDLKSFTLATFLGIIPGTIAFSWLGGGLDSIIAAQKSAHDTCLAAKSPAACPFELSASSLLTPELLTAFVVLGVIALIPIAVKKWRKPS